ncbi:MAG: lasso peptide biosynthesis B2 protein [Pseudomonadota bacterium]
MRFVRRTRLFLRCVFLVLIVRIGLWLVRYQTLRHWLVRVCATDPQASRQGTVIHAMRMVERVARFVPDASCLTQSIAGQALLSWYGIPSTISMGVMKERDDDLKAHAWLVWNGKVVLQGNTQTPRTYAKIADLPTPVSGASAKV